MRMRYDFGRLARVMGLSEYAAGVALGIDESSLTLYRRVGMTELAADRIAVRAGFHPWNVWPEMVEHAIAWDRARCASGTLRKRQLRERKAA